MAAPRMVPSADDEADLAERLAWLQPADAHEVGRLPLADEPDDQRGNRDARADDHAGAERGGGDAQILSASRCPSASGRAGRAKAG